MSISGAINPEPEPALVDEAKEVQGEQEVNMTATPEIAKADPLPAVEDPDAGMVDPTPENKPATESTGLNDAVLSALLNKIQPVQKAKKNLKVLIYSDPGAGKTTLLGGIPNSLIVDVEGGLTSINNHPDLVAPNVNTYPYKSFDALEVIMGKFHEGPQELAHIETLSLDSISELHKRGLAEVTEREWKRNPISNNRYVAETEQHTENNEHIRRLVSSLRDLDRNIVMTAHARTIEPKNKPAKTFPDFSEKLANTIAGIVDIVAYMYLKEVDGEVRRILRFHGNGSIVAKTRVGGFPEEMVNPTWDQIWNIFKTNN